MIEKIILGSLVVGPCVFIGLLFGGDFWILILISVSGVLLSERYFGLEMS